MRLIRLSLEEVNNLPSNDFIKVFGNIIERNPIAAIKILKFRPFRKVEDLISAFYNYLETLNNIEKEHILKFQMDITAKVDEIKQKYLFNNVRDDTMCIIDTCTYEINLLNEQYKRKFKLPFVISANHFSILSILHAMEFRMENDKEEEVMEAFDEVKRIISYKVYSIITTE